MDIYLSKEEEVSVLTVLVYTNHSKHETGAWPLLLPR